MAMAHEYGVVYVGIIIRLDSAGLGTNVNKHVTFKQKREFISLW